MRYVTTAYFWTLFLLTAPLGAALGGLVFLATAPWDKHRRWLHLFLSFWGHGYLLLNPFWKVKVRHRERLPRGKAVLVCNHQSMADIFVVMGILHPFKFVSKASVFRVPLVGWMMSLAGYVAIERGKTRSTQRMLDDCRKWLSRDMAVLIFPEGTYSPNGQMLPFKRGAFKLALEENVPLVPIVLEGTRSLVIEDGPWLSPKCRIFVTVLPPVSTEVFGTDEEALLRHVRSQMDVTPQPS